MVFFFCWIVLTVAVSLSAIGGYFSIFGLQTIFAGASYEITILAIILEIAKVVMAAWLHYFWKYVSRTGKIGLSGALITLMFITSLGIYGYMSRAHIEHSTTIQTTNAPQLLLLDNKIQNLEALKAGIDSQVAQIDKSISQLKGNVALNALAKQRAEKDKLIKQQQTYVTELIKLRQDKANLNITQSRLETEIGPLLYVAQIMNLERDQAVKLFMLLLLIVTDPLAIGLIIVVTSVMAKLSEEKSRREVPTNEVKIVGQNGKLPEIDLDKFFKYNSNNISALDLTKAKI